MHMLPFPFIVSGLTKASTSLDLKVGISLPLKLLHEIRSKYFLSTEYFAIGVLRYRDGNPDARAWGSFALPTQLPRSNISVSHPHLVTLGDKHRRIESRVLSGLESLSQLIKQQSLKSV